MVSQAFKAAIGPTLSRLWNTSEFLKATMLHASGPVAYANITCVTCQGRSGLDLAKITFHCASFLHRYFFCFAPRW